METSQPISEDTEGHMGLNSPVIQWRTCEFDVPRHRSSVENSGFVVGPSFVGDEFLPTIIQVLFDKP